jgi:hypothetical protein
MNNLKIYTKVKQEWLNNDDISTEDLLIYSMIVKNKIYEDSLFTLSVTNINDITLRLIQSNENKNNRRWHNNIRTGINNLIDSKIIIDIYNVFNDKITLDDLGSYETFYVKTESINLDFININQKDLDVALTLIKGSKISKFCFLRHCIEIRESINNEYKFGYLPEKASNFIKDFGTISQYNDILKDKLFLVEYGYAETRSKSPIVLFADINNKEIFMSQIENMIKSREIYKINNKLETPKVIDYSISNKTKNDTCVYIMKNSNGDSLYVGITNNHNKRITQHCADKKWISQVDEILISEYINRNQARIFEIYYISKLNPRYNNEFNRLDCDNFKLDLDELTFNNFIFDKIKK